MKSYLAAAIQMNSVPDLQKNLVQAEKLIGIAVSKGAELIGLPENFSFWEAETEMLDRAKEIAETSENFLKKMAQQYQITLLGGGFPVPTENGKVYNTAMLVNPQGKELASYQKVHLFDVSLPDGNIYRESSTFIAGTQLPTVYYSEQLGNMGFSICYDLRFPELYRHLAKIGAEILFVTAAFTTYTGKDHWQILLQARAIENSCYVIAPAQTGRHYGTQQSYGHAMIIDPWGIVLADAGEKPGMAIAQINPTRLQEVRNNSEFGICATRRLRQRNSEFGRIINNRRIE